MRIINTKEPVLLGLGDLIILALSLYVTLAVRYREIPSQGLINSHALAFLIIFAYSILFFYISGLYGRMIVIARSSIPGMIIRTQIANGLIEVALYYFVPSFSDTPKINLFIYIALSTSFLILWRLSTYSIFSLRRKNSALVIGSSPEVEELVAEMSVNTRIGLLCSAQIDPAHLSRDIAAALDPLPEFQYIVADTTSPQIDSVLPELYRRYFPHVQIIDVHELYESVFNRIPLSCMNYTWIMSHISAITPKFYDITKRSLDIFFGVVICIATGIVYPFVALAIKLEDRGPIFIRQERTGQHEVPIHYYKFRSMQRNEAGKWIAESDNRVTKVGHFIRKTRIDELPQGLAVLKGDMSLIGPRSDIAGLGDRLKGAIPYYSVRTIVKPGLTGWAQISQNKPPQTIEENKVRLSYDLYYIRHRSFNLDLQIVLKTFKTLLSREGM